VGIDLLNYEKIQKFFYFFSSKIHKFYLTAFFFALDSSSENLSDLSEKKRKFLNSKINILSKEKTKKSNSAKDKCLILAEIYNMQKLTKDVGVYEIKLNPKNQNPIESFEFDKLSIYMKEHRDIFEAVKEEVKEEPSSTFKLSLNENELTAKNDVILPYLRNSGNEKKDNIITIDQEDLNELYEEDPDGDLDI